MNSPEPPHRPTVLVVDDEPIVLKSIQAALSGDHRLLEADTALKALAISDAFPGSIDVIVADRTLKSYTGQQVIEKIRAARPETQVLYFSSFSRDHPANAGLPADAAILEKPFSPRDLRGAIFRLLRAREEASDNADSQLGIERRKPECVDRLRDEISVSTSLFGRLAAASRLWNSLTGCYEHALSACYGPEAVDDALEFLHHEILSSFLSLPLRLQKADLSIYLSAAAGSRSDIRRLISLGKAVLPVTAMECERQLFLSDLTLIQSALQFESS